MVYKKKLIKKKDYNIRCLVCKKVFNPIYKIEVIRKICYGCNINDKDKEYYAKKNFYNNI